MTKGRSTICLCMVVEHEAEFITRCLESCRGIVDHWVICDTGSTGDTESLVRDALAGIPGELHRTAWVDAATNRSELLKRAHGKADYLLLLDADMVVSVNTQIGELNAGSYMIRESRGSGELIWFNKRLLNAGLHWRFEGPYHGYVECVDGPETVARLDAITVQSPAGEQAAAPGELEHALELLSATLQEQPDDPRALFYLGQTCFELGLAGDNQAMLLNAIEHYQHRADLEDGWEEEAYHAQHQVGVIAEHIGDWPLAIDAYMRAWELRPQRLESVQRLTTGLRERQLYHAAHRFARMASRLRPLQMPDDSLLVAPWVYEWGMLFEYSITSYWVGEHRNSINACRALLDIPSLPEAHRTQTQRNLELTTREDRKASARTSASRRRQIKSSGSNTKPRDVDLSLGVRATDLVARAMQHLEVSEAEIRPLLREGGAPRELVMPGLGPIALRPGGRDLLTLVKLLENPAQLAPSELGSAETITVLGAGSGIGALFLGRLYPTASVRVVSADSDDAELCAQNVRSLEDRAVIQLAGEQGPADAPIDLLRVEIDGVGLLAAEPGWLECAKHALVVPGQEGPGAVLSELRLRGFDARIGSEGQVVARRTVGVEGA